MLNKVSCGYCNGVLFWGDGIYNAEDCRWYHEKCTEAKSRKRQLILTKKFRAGNITLDEAKELEDINLLLKNIKKDQIIVPLSVVLGEQSKIIFSGNTPAAMQNLQQRTAKKQQEKLGKAEETKFIEAPKPKAKKLKKIKRNIKKKVKK